jgi:hypothetical protein
MALTKIAENKRHFIGPEGTPIFVMGVNYNGYFDRAWQMWKSFDADLINRDFHKAKNSGFNTIRISINATLAAEIEQNNFEKFDRLVDTARQQQLLLILTLNDAHVLDLNKAGQLDAKIVAHYQDNPTILAYDLENEPTFYHLAAATYPEHLSAAIQTSQLVDQYGARVEQDAIADLRRSRHIPEHLNDEATFHYINALHIFREYEAALESFEAQGRGSVFDYLISDEATRWHPLIGVLESTIDSWLKARIEPIRAAGCQHPLTVGWNKLHLALLPGNHQLDFQSYHRFTSLSLSDFNENIAHLNNLRRAFPDHPILLTEFGWGNHADDPKLTALYEAATYSYLRANNFGGGCKWTLNDMEISESASVGHEASFGVFKVGDEAKPIGSLVQYFAENWPSVEEQAVFFNVWRDLQSGLAYRFDFPQQVSVGGHLYQDNAISWQAESQAAHCFIKRDLEKIIIESHGAGRLSIDPWNLVPIWRKNRQADLYRVYTETSHTRQNSFAPGQTVVIDVRPGAQYMVRMGAESVSANITSVAPKPGEHVLLLADSDNYLPAALEYIRRFAPDLTFTPDDIAERWAYVSVVALPEQVSDEQLEDMRAVGATIVERVIGDNPVATQAILDDLASRGQRFLTHLSQESPVGDTPETYTVQPGDSLNKIAQQLYGDFQRWSLIFEANQDQISDPTFVRVGTILRIPEAV